LFDLVESTDGANGGPEQGEKTVGTMRILDETGDATVDWSLDDDDAVRRAEGLFKHLIGERQMAFARKVGTGVEEAERVHSFDPEAEEILWVRPIQGG
jgi:hypothetical protein